MPIVALVGATVQALMPCLLAKLGTAILQKQ